MLFQWCFQGHRFAGNTGYICFVRKAEFYTTVGTSEGVARVLHFACPLQKSDEFPEMNKFHSILATVAKNPGFCSDV